MAGEERTVMLLLLQVFVVFFLSCGMQRGPSQLVLWFPTSEL